MEPWAQFPVRAWPDVAEILTASSLPWPDGAAVFDLRYYADQVERGFEVKMLGYRRFMKRWNWSEPRTRALMRDEARWRKPPQSLRSGVRSASAPKHGPSPNIKENPPRPLRSPSAPTPDTRVGSQITRTPDHQKKEPPAPGGDPVLFSTSSKLSEEQERWLQRFLDMKHSHDRRWSDPDERLRKAWPDILSRMPKGHDQPMNVCARLDDWLRDDPKGRRRKDFKRNVDQWLTGQVAQRIAADNLRRQHEQDAERTRRSRTPAARDLPPTPPVPADPNDGMLYDPRRSNDSRRSTSLSVVPGGRARAARDRAARTGDTDP